MTRPIAFVCISRGFIGDPVETPAIHEEAVESHRMVDATAEPIKTNI